MEWKLKGLTVNYDEEKKTASIDYSESQHKLPQTGPDAVISITNGLTLHVKGGSINRIELETVPHTLGGILAAFRERSSSWDLPNRVRDFEEALKTRRYEKML